MADILRIIGIVLYVLTSVVDKFIYSIPDGLYIPLSIIGIACLIVGTFMNIKK